MSSRALHARAARVFQPRACALAVAAAIGCTFLAAPAWSQGAGERKSYSVAAGNLDEALNAFARQAGITLSFDPALLRGKQARGVSGNLTADEGLASLLREHGMEAVRTGSGAYTVRPAAKPEAVLPTVTVTGRAALPGDLPAPYAGGQVARGAGLGMLGNLDVMDTPFNITSYTDKTIEDQQARSLADFIGKNDPSVRVWGGLGDSTDTMRIRGFDLAMDEVSFNGLPGLLAQYRSGTEFIERVEVLKGPGAMLKGMSPSGASGGSVNVIAKRAGDVPLTRLTAGYYSSSRWGLHADIGRRFGENNQFGVRVNGLLRKGDTPRNYQTEDMRIGSLSLDYRGERVRANLDYIYQSNEDYGARTVLNTYAVVPGVALPPPDARNNFTQQWSRLDNWTRTVTGRVEADLTPDLTLYGAVGRAPSWHGGKGGNVSLIDRAGNTRQPAASSVFIIDTTSAEVGINGRFRTGAVGHRWAVSAATLERDVYFAGTTAVANIFNNIYNPVQVPEPVGIVAASRVKTNTNELPSYGIADTLSFIDDRLQVTLGLRHQTVQISNFNAAGAVTTRYNRSAVTPMVGVLGKAWQGGALYANYIEGLAQGGVAPPAAANAGEALEPFQNKQVEAGIKQDWGRFGLTAGVFQITRQSAATDAVSNRYQVNGRQRNRGIEVNFFGEPLRGVRLLGGASLLDAEMIASPTANVIGKRPVGVPRFTANLGTEWDVPAATGLTLTAAAIHTGSSYADASNATFVNGWTRFDIGARYVTRVQGKQVTLRALVENATNRNYWSVGSFTAVYLGLPRNYSVSASMDF